MILTAKKLFRKTLQQSNNMSQPIALFCSEQKIKNFTSANANLSPELLTPFILEAQDIELQYYLGSTFYFSIQDQVLTGTVSADNQFLLDNYISKALIQWGLMRALPFIKYRIFNKSVLSPTAENAESITLEELQFLQQELRTAGNFYAERMNDWIVLHPGAYSVFFSQRVNDGMMPSYAPGQYGELVTPVMPYAWKKYFSRGGVNDPSYCPEGLFPNTYVNTSIGPS